MNWTPIQDFVAPGDFETIDDNGTSTTTDDVEMQYLNVDKQPPAIDPVSNRHFEESERRNNASLVFQIHYHDTSFLFTGDINGRKMFEDPDDAIDSEEAELLARHKQHLTFSLKATVLQVSHHGSDGASSLPFLKAVDPEWAVIPAGNAFGHPHGPTLDRLKKAVDPDSHILRTDDGPDGNDPTGDDNFVFVVDATGLREILRIVVD